MTFDLSNFIFSMLVMSVIVCATFLFTLLFPKAISEKWKKAVWLILLLGFLVPFRPLVGDGIWKVQQREAAIQTINASEISVAQEGLSESIDIEQTRPKEPTSTFKWSNQASAIAILGIWCLTAILILLFHLIRYFRFMRMVKRWGVDIDDSEYLKIFNSVKSELSLQDKEVRLVRCKFISTSMLTGFSKPVVLLPDKKFDSEELRLIFRHELIHFKRHDIYVKLFSLVAIAIYWFNPAVYLLYKGIQHNSETACDEAVLDGANVDERLLYGEVMISMIATDKAHAPILSTCFFGSKFNIKRRFVSMMENNKKKKTLTVAIVIAVLALTILSGSVIAFARDNTAPIDQKQAAVSEISVERAKEIALAKVGGGSVVKCVLEYDNGAKEYDVVIENNDRVYSLDIDVYSEAITDYSEEQISQPTMQPLQPRQQQVQPSVSTENKISAERAKEIALAKVGGGSVVKCVLEYDDGIEEYDVDIILNDIKYEMDINAYNGSINDYSEERIYNVATPTNENTVAGYDDDRYDDRYDDDRYDDNRYDDDRYDDHDDYDDNYDD